MKKKTTIYLDEQDRAAIATLKERYGVTSDSDTIRLALRLLAKQAKGRKKHGQEAERTPEHTASAPLSDS